MMKGLFGEFHIQASNLELLNLFYYILTILTQRPIKIQLSSRSEHHPCGQKLKAI